MPQSYSINGWNYDTECINGTTRTRVWRYCDHCDEEILDGEDHECTKEETGEVKN